jgi:hypothetical protein
LLEYFRYREARVPKMSKAAKFAASIRVASKGVYAGGGSIAEEARQCKAGASGERL